MLVSLQGAAARCCCRVLLLEWRARVGAGLLGPRQRAASRCYFWSGVCGLELACWCRYSVLLQAAPAGCWLLQGAAVTEVPLQVVLPEWWVCCGAGLLALLHGWGCRVLLSKGGCLHLRNLVLLQGVLLSECGLRY